MLLAVAENKRLIVSEIMHHASTTFSHATNLVAELETRGLVTTSSEGRVKYVQATQLGIKAAKAVRAVSNLGESDKVISDIEKLNKRAQQLLGDLESLEKKGEDTASLSDRLRRLNSSMTIIEYQIRATGIKGNVPGWKELRETVKALKVKILSNNDESVKT